MLPRSAWLSALLLVGCSIDLPDPSALVDAGAADAAATDGDAGASWSWHAEALPFANTIHGLWGAPGALWAVGNTGLIARHDGTSWSRVTAPTNVDLRAVWGAASDDVWAVGDAGTILRYTGGGWTKQSSPITDALYGLWGSGGGDVWAVGDAGAVLHYDGSAWSAATEGSADLRAVWGSGAKDVWAGGTSGALLRNQGSGWSSVTSGTTRTLFGLWVRSASEVWVAAAGGAVLRFDGSSWSVKTLDAAVSFRAVSGRAGAGAGAEVWVVGDRAGQGEIYGLQGGAWSAAGSHPGVILHALWVGPSGQAWAAGGGKQQAYRYGP